MFSERRDCADWEHLSEGVHVKAWKLHKEMYTTKGTYKDAQLKFVRPRGHGNLE